MALGSILHLNYSSRDIAHNDGEAEVLEWEDLWGRRECAVLLFTTWMSRKQKWDQKQSWAITLKAHLLLPKPPARLYSPKLSSSSKIASLAS